MDDPNKLHHIFANPDHNLDALVQAYGSEEAAGRLIVEAINEAYQNGSLAADALGRYTRVFDVGGYLVTVRGRIVNGVVRVGSAWIRNSANGDTNG